MAQEELDLRPYVQVVVKRWPVVLVVTLVFVVLAVAATSLRSPSYRATATLDVTPPRYLWRFEPTIKASTNPNKDPRDVVLALAKAPRLVAALTGYS